MNESTASYATQISSISLPRCFDFQLKIQCHAEWKNRCY